MLISIRVCETDLAAAHCPRAKRYGTPPGCGTKLSAAADPCATAAAAAEAAAAAGGGQNFLDSSDAAEKWFEQR